MSPALERGLRAVARGTRVSGTIKADVVISTGGGTCAFQLHTNFSHGHVAEALHQKLRLDHPHRGILAELLRGLGVPDWRQEADLLLDAFGSISTLIFFRP
ncbi:hypothetical protein Esi_0338_0029 [Ectocarpus siliculosus]|uniref:Uncharacterized protein n=1 Tax=Ectocarpus siliculosus TaxID=2880 RepID=D7FY24_ECTSI|nr:hypothetical protein Esi_0338_0029 [Ectocarpus siliculosus]|eukprot:CBJ32437.1 hypothetical protein Esi_0338_0029 [Ectocarpus siliculosus]